MRFANSMYNFWRVPIEIISASQNTLKLNSLLNSSLAAISKLKADLQARERDITAL
jgi:hypothetical protein